MKLSKDVDPETALDEQKVLGKEKEDAQLALRERTTEHICQKVNVNLEAALDEQKGLRKEKEDAHLDFHGELDEHSFQNFG